MRDLARSGTQFTKLKQGLAMWRGAWWAIVAVGNKILHIAFKMLRDGRPYQDPEIDYATLVAKPNRTR